MIKKIKTVMAVRARLLYGTTLCIILLLLAAYFAGPVHKQIPANSVQRGASRSSQATPANPVGIDAGNLDKLLDLAEKDVAQLSRVKITGHNGSASLDMLRSSVAWQESSGFSPLTGNVYSTVGPKPYGWLT